MRQNTTGRRCRSFIRVCHNKPTRLVFGHDNSYLEKARHDLQDFLFITSDRIVRKSTDNTAGADTGRSYMLVLYRSVLCTTKRKPYTRV